MTKPTMKWISLLAAALFRAASLPAADPPAAKPEVWMMPPGGPDGNALRALFTKPDEWKRTRQSVNVLGYAGQQLDKQFTDDELRAWLPMLGRWGLKLGLEVGAVKPWGTTGAKVFGIERKMWDRFERLGGHVDAIAMDEPLCCARKDLKQPDAYAVEETAQFIALVRKNYPGMRVGDIEPYPFISQPDLVAFIDALQSRLKALHVRGLDFFRLDVDWVHFVVGKNGGWPEVKKLELACRARKLPFSLIYWAADYGHLQRVNFADDETWYLGLMHQAQDYLMVNGRPDQFVIESWIGAPSRTVPEGDEWTFCRSVRDFCERYVKPRP